MTRGDFDTELDKVKVAAKVLLDTVPTNLTGPEWRGARGALAAVITMLRTVEDRLPRA